LYRIYDQSHFYYLFGTGIEQLETLFVFHFKDNPSKGTDIRREIAYFINLNQT